MQNQNHKKSEIERYYSRTQQGAHGNNYYLEPSDMCPIEIMQVRNRFVILTFDKQDDYVVIANKRYYLNRHNSLKCTNKTSRRVAVVDLEALKKSKGYPYDQKYKHDHTLEVQDFSTLEAEAERQYSYNGLPYIKQLAKYDPKKNICSYYYEPSFKAA